MRPAISDPQSRSILGYLLQPLIITALLITLLPLQSSATPRIPQSQTPDIDFLAARDGPIRLLVVGDSMTHGSEGDHTWRYRIWDWFREQKVAVTFVGPYIGTYGPPDGTALLPQYLGLDGIPPSLDGERTWGLYAKDCDPEFQSNHFAVAGRTAAVDKSLIETVVTKYPADLMLLMLGFNDLGWHISDPQGLISSMDVIITTARRVNPQLKFAVSNVVMRSRIGTTILPNWTDEYNALLPDTIARWSTVTSPIELVKLRETYSCELEDCPSGWDGLHPNTRGEYEIAHAFSETLVSKYGLGTLPLTIPPLSSIPGRIIPPPTELEVHTSPGVMFATWDPVFGAYGYDVQVRIQGVADWWNTTVWRYPWRYDVTWLVNDWVYDIRVRAQCGKEKGDWTPITTVTALGVNPLRRIFEVDTTQAVIGS